MLSFLSLLLRRKRTIVTAAVAGFVVSVALSLVLPSKYVSTAAFIPGGVEQELTGRSSFLSRLGSFSESYATFIRVGRNFIIDYIIRSNRMAEMMDSRFDLKEMYGEDSIEGARERLGRKTFVNVRDEGVIEVAVEAPGAVLARDMTAAYIELLDSILVDLSIENSAGRIAYLEKEVARAEREGTVADSVMSEYMVTRGIFDVESQAKAAFQIIGALSARVSALEVERNIMSLSMNEDSPDLRRIELQIEKLKDEIEKATEMGDQGGLYPPLSKMPGLAGEYLGMVAERRAREVALAYLRFKLEDARISAGSRLSSIRVIDPPVVPQRRSWPKRKQIVIILTMASIFWTCFVILVRDKAAREKEAEAEG